MKIFLDTLPLRSGHVLRGVGVYTKYLLAALEKCPNVEVLTRSRANHHQADVVHYPYFDLFFPTLPLFEFSPTVVTIHDLIPLKFPDHYPVGWRGRLSYWRQKQALRRVRRVVTDSQASAVDITEQFPFLTNRVTTVHLAPNPEIIIPSTPKLAKIRHHYHLPKKYLLYVGDINYNKNLPELIKSLEFLPDWLHLVCVGNHFSPQPIPEWLAIDRQIAISQVESRVHLINDLPADQSLDLAGIYHLATALIQPSLSEGFGLPVLEAMSAKTPVVCAQNSSLVEVGGSHVIYTGTDAQLIAWGVEKVLGWQASRHQAWVGAAYTWSQNFSWEKVAQQMINVYQSVIDSR